MVIPLALHINLDKMLYHMLNIICCAPAASFYINFVKSSLTMQTAECKLYMQFFLNLYLPVFMCLHMWSRAELFLLSSVLSFLICSQSVPKTGEMDGTF